jgi:hypothetical protein
MKSRRMFSVLVLFSLHLGGARAEETVNSSLANANVGDWIEYIVHTTAKGKSVGTIQRRTVTAKDTKSITIKTETRAVERIVPGSEINIPLDKPYNPCVNDPDAKVEKLEEGDEKVTIRGKEYAAHWCRYKGTSKAGAPIEGKMWISKDVALGGMIKMETSNSDMSLTKTSSDK